jgi:hypothetical protein
VGLWQVVAQVVECAKVTVTRGVQSAVQRAGFSKETKDLMSLIIESA